MKKIFVFLVLIFIMGGGFYLFYQEGALPVQKDDSSKKIFVIKKGESLSSIADSLEREKFIRSKVIFYLVVKRLGIERKIQAGDFRLSPSMNAHEIAKELTHGTLDVWITIIEGMRKEEIAHIISQNLDIPEVEFLQYAREGYLFPDTYLVPKQATASAIIEILLSNFNTRFHKNFQIKARSKNLTVEQVLTLASLVEREAKFGEDRQKVADVLLRRYTEGHPLQVDSTVQYALGYQPYDKTWWKKVLSFADLEIDSPYNTYKVTGLPPGPIANPGLASIEAVIEADPNTPYLFYVSDSAGRLHFAKTLAEHEENIRKYLR